MKFGIMGAGGSVLTLEDERKTKKARFLIVFQKEAMIESFWRLEGGCDEQRNDRRDDTGKGDLKRA